MIEEFIEERGEISQDSIYQLRATRLAHRIRVHDPQPLVVQDAAGVICAAAGGKMKGLYEYAEAVGLGARLIFWLISFGVAMVMLVIGKLIAFVYGLLVGGQ